VAHGADAFGDALVAGFGVEVGVAAPEVLFGDVAGGHLEAFVPAVVVGAVAGDEVACEGAHGVDVGLAGFERLGVGAVDVGEDLRVVGGDDESVAELVGDGEWRGHCSVSSGAQSGWLPCMAW
jgi:hypothetical protein